MPERGRLTEWNDERGFGFITPLDGSPRVFVHVSEFPSDKRRPEALDLLVYSVGTDKRGRLRASNVKFMAPTHDKHYEPRHIETANGPRTKHALVIAALFLSLLAALALARLLASEILGVYLTLSAISFAAYALDKSAAERGAWRTSETTLHLLALAGGWPGALVAQQVLRHKTIKQPFRSLFWVTVGGNLLFLFLFLAGQVGSGPG